MDADVDSAVVQDAGTAGQGGATAAADAVQVSLLPGNRTITSGVGRLRTLADDASTVLSDFAALVGDMSGSMPDAGLTGSGSTESTGTAGAINDVASLFESFVMQIAGLVKAARAVHG